MLGVDPGFASVGVAVVEVGSASELIMDVRVFTTEKSDKKRKVRASDDNFDRTQRLYIALRDYVVEYGVSAICAEAMSCPRNASVAGKMSLFWGALASVAAQYQLPLVQASPQEMKRVVAGAPSASKVDMAVALRSRYPGQFDSFSSKFPKAEHEHGFDAAAAVVACLNSDVLQLIRRLG